MKDFSTTRACIAVTIRLVEFVVGSAMVVSAWYHLQNHMLFYIHVAKYELLPTYLLSPFVLTMPWLLLFAGLLIITRSGRPVGSVVGASLFLLFIVGQLGVMWSGKDIDCGCFGFQLNDKIGLGTVSRTAGLFVGCIILIWMGNPDKLKRREAIQDSV